MPVTINGTTGIVSPALDLTTPLPVADGGTGVGTLTGVVKGNGTSAFTSGNVSLASEVTGTLPIANGGTGSTSTQFANLTSNVTGTLPVANGGTGAATLTANNVLLGNGTSAVQAVAPGTSGNVLVSNGTTWTSAAVPSDNWTTLGSTIVWRGSPSDTSPYNFSAAGMLWATDNILTKRPKLISTPPIEQQLNITPLTVSTNTTYEYLTVSALTALGVSNTLDGTIQKLVRDGFTGRYSVAPACAGLESYNSDVKYFMSGFTTDFVQWAPYQGASSGSPSPYISAFNHYTGTNISVLLPSAAFQATFYRYIANIAYNLKSATNSFNINSIVGGTDVRAHNVGFLDTGTQSTSRLYVIARENSGGTAAAYFVYSTGTNDGATGTWTSVSIGNTTTIPSRIVGSTAEIMFYVNNSGIYRSTNLGDTWSTYVFGDNVIGTNGSYYPMSITWNNTTWLAVFNNNLVTKTMGSGTSWTRLTNASSIFPTPGAGAVAYNPTLSAWLVISVDGEIYYNTNSDPNAGTWTFASRVTAGNTNFGFGLSVIAANTFNF